MDIRTLIKLKAILDAGGKIETETATATGNPAAFYTDIAKALSALSVSFLPIQEGSGDPSASNIRNISGMTGMTVTANGTAIAISWQSQAGTVYGGSLDVLTGALTVEWEMVSGRWGDLESSGPNPDTGYYSKALYFTNFPQKCVNESDYGDKVITNFCSKILWDTAGRTPEHFFILGSPHDSKKVYIYGNYDNDLVVQVAAKLATPLTYQLTAQEVSSIVGDNSISATGNSTLSVTYTRYKEYTASGAVASFITNIELPMLVTASITPVQDLSGGEPYPPGGGKNKWAYDASFSKDDSVLYNSYDVNLPAGTYTVSGVFTSGDTTNNKVRVTFRNGSGGLAAAKPTANSGARTSDTVTIEETCTKIYIYGGDTTSTKYAMTATELMIESGSTATPYSPYSHICPITGWTGAEVTGAGVNLFDQSTIIHNGMKPTGEIFAGTDERYRTVDIESLPAGTYTISTDLPNCFFIRRVVDGNVTAIGNTAQSYTFTCTTTGRFAISFRNTSSSEITTEPNVQLEKSSTASPYHAYSGTTLSVDWQTEAGTVYGGSLKVNKDGTGVLTVTSQKLVYDGSDDEGWTKNGANGFTSALTGYTGTPICNYLKGLEPGSSGGLTTWSARLSTALTYFMAKPDVSVYDTAAKWKTYLSENNLEAVVSLATPVTYTITAQQAGQLLSKQGQNNVWSSTGDTTVTYNKKA